MNKVAMQLKAMEIDEKVDQQVDQQHGEKVDQKVDQQMSSVEQVAEKIVESVAGPLKELSGCAYKQTVAEISNESRMMYLDLDVHEALRQIATAIYVFNSTASMPSWLAAIIQRELSKLEKSRGSG